MISVKRNEVNLRDECGPKEHQAKVLPLAESGIRWALCLHCCAFV